MALGQAKTEGMDDPQIVLGVLQALDGDQTLSQRTLAAELGIALGLANAYIKRCISKGLIKVSQAPARRYAYYLTPLGFAEKSRLTLEFLTSSFEFFRRAKADCSELYREIADEGRKRVLFVGRSDLTEIAALCAQEHDVDVAGLLDPTGSSASFLGKAVFPSFDAAPVCDFIIITDLRATQTLVDEAVARFPNTRVLVPKLLRHLLVSKEARHG